MISSQSLPLEQVIGQVLGNFDLHEHSSMSSNFLFSFQDWFWTSWIFISSFTLATSRSPWRLDVKSHGTLGTQNLFRIIYHRLLSTWSVYLESLWDLAQEKKWFKDIDILPICVRCFWYFVSDSVVCERLILLRCFLIRPSFRSCSQEIFFVDRKIRKKLDAGRIGWEIYSSLAQQSKKRRKVARFIDRCHN